MTHAPRRATIALLLAGLLIPMHTAHADADRSWHLRLTAAAYVPTVGLGTNQALGVGLGAGYRISDRVGVELDITQAEIDRALDLPFVFFGDGLYQIRSTVDTTTILARLQAHLTPNRKVDLFVGPVAGWLNTSDLRVTFRLGDDIQAPGDFLVSAQDVFAWGANIGFDVAFGQTNLFATTRLTYLQAEIDVDNFDEAGFDLDPLIVELGLGYRF